MGGHLTWNQWNVVTKELPRLGMREGVKEIMCRLCRTKPQTTYDNEVGNFGVRYVEGYSLEGEKFIDRLEMTVN